MKERKLSIESFSTEAKAKHSFPLGILDSRFHNVCYDTMSLAVARKCLYRRLFAKSEKKKLTYVIH